MCTPSFIISEMSKRTECGGNITDRAGTISYPDEDSMEHYNNNIDCWWYIIANESDKVEVEFPYVDIQGSAGCKDHLSVRHYGGWFVPFRLFAPK